MSQIERREFLIRGSALTAAGVALAPALGGRGGLVEGAVALRRRLEERPAPLAVLRGRGGAARLPRACARLGGLGCRGRSVLVKPTLTFLRGPGREGNVQPDVLRSVLALLLREGASRIVVCDRTAAPARLVHALSGAREVVRELNDRRIDLMSLEDSDFVPVRARHTSIPGAREAAHRPEELGSLRVVRHLLEADVVVGLAAARRCPARGAALAIANLRGLFGGGEADKAWEARRVRETVALAASVRPEWTFLDSTAAGAPALVVSRDLLAVEAFGAVHLGLTAGELPWVEVAREMGLGSPDLAPPRILES